jgi:hypothetical protein
VGVRNESKIAGAVRVQPKPGLANERVTALNSNFDFFFLLGPFRHG